MLRPMPGKDSSDIDRQLRRIRLQAAVGEAQRAAALIRLRHGDDVYLAQAACVAAIRALRADIAASGDDEELYGTNEMAINELCVLADFANAATHPELEIRSFYDEATTIAEGSGALLVARVHVDHALWHRDKARYAAALALLLDARDRLGPADTLPSKPQINAAAKVAAAIAETYRWLDDLERAADTLRQARDDLDRLAKLADASGDSIEQWFRSEDRDRLRFEKALLFMDAGRWRFADASFPDIDAYLAKVGVLGATVRAFYRSRVDAGLGRLEVALAELEAALPAASAHSWLAGRRAAMTTQYSKLLSKQGRDADALMAACQASAFAAASGSSDTAWEAYWQRARLTAATAGAAAALPAFDEALAMIDTSRRASLGLRLDSLFLRRRRPVIDAAVIAAASDDDPTRVASYADIAKSRFLAAALHAGPPPPAPPELLSSLDAVNAAIAAAPAESLATLRAERAALLERIRLGRGELAPPPHDIDAIGALLAAGNQAALQLFVTDDRQLITVLLHRGAIRHDVRPLGDKAWRGLAAYRANLALRHPSSLNYDPATLVPDAGMLAAPELLEQALGASALIVAPHGLLNIVPWSSLIFGGRRLFEWLPVAQVPCLAAIPALASRRTAARRMAIFGNPGSELLSGMEKGADLSRTIDAVSHAIGDEILVHPPVVRAAATVAGFRALAGEAALDCGMLHLACHGRFDARDPDSAGLVVADRMLTAAEIALYPLAAREVTLAACSTAVRPPSAAGVQLRGDDVVGLPAAFLEAGAASIIVSVTPAGDGEAAAFFAAYYSQRRAGRPSLSAFNETQKAMLADGSSKLRRWAGFTFYGVA